MRIVGCIPAKGSSTRTPSKNLQEVLGVPLFLWAANNLNRVLPKKDIYIDSDSDDILELAQKHGFNTIKRPDELATNATDGNQLMMWQAKNVDADIFIQHLPPMLFLKEETLRKGIDLIIEKNYDSAFAVMKEQLYLWDDNGPKYDLKNLPNSFTLPTTTIETMGLYITTKKSLLESELRVGNKTSMIEIDKYEAIDIDYPTDLEFARVVSKGLGFNSEYTKGISSFYKYKNIKLIIIDIDGVMTDGGMYYTENGDEMKKFNTKDGMAIKNIIKNGMQIGFLSSGKNINIIQNRADLLGVQNVYAGYEKKTKILDEWIDKLNISYEQVAYIGDDINDIDAMSKCKIKACPNDAVSSIKDIVDIVLSRNGGEACVREFIDKYIVGE